MYDLCINVNEVKIQKHSQELRSDYRKELMQTDFPQNVFVKLRYVVFNQRKDLSPLLFLWRKENCHWQSSLTELCMAAAMATVGRVAQ